MDLLELRKEIDRIDDQLIPLLMARMDVSEQVAKYKVERGIPVGAGYADQYGVFGVLLRS